MVSTDTETGMLPGVPGSAICVQKFDDSLNSAIRITYRISLRSSSLREPRHPLLKVVRMFLVKSITANKSSDTSQSQICTCIWGDLLSGLNKKLSMSPPNHAASLDTARSRLLMISTCSHYSGCKVVVLVWIIHFNDPSAGSPTETLLRLHLPLNGKV